MENLSISLKDVRLAQERLAGKVHRTPLMHSRTLSDRSGFEVYMKPENLQRTGSFKVRGALNKILSLPPEEARKGLITASSGNHGQGVAYAARALGYASTVVMPEGGSEAKAASIRGYGGEVLFCGTKSGERIALAKQLCAERGLTFVHPYDDPMVMAGQGTIGLEVLQDLTDVAAVLIPTGGGGLISGIATAIKEQNPSVKVFGVEPEGSNSTELSFRNKARTNLDKIETVADGIKTSIPGELTFPVVMRYVDDMLLVDEEAILHAQRMMLERCKLLAEPTGAVTMAAVLSGKLPASLKGKKVVPLISGGNTSLDLLAKYIVEAKQIPKK